MGEGKGPPEDVQGPELEAEEERLRRVLSTTPMFVWERKLSANKVETLHDGLGVQADTSEQLLGWVHGEDREKVRDALARVVAGERVGAVDFRLASPGGQERWCSFRARRRCGPDGQPTHIYGVTIDITERVLAAKAAVEEVTRARNELLAVLGHELRTPLTPARALVQMLERDASLAPEQQAMAAEIGRHIGFEKRLIEDLLTFERLVHDKIQLNLAPVEIHEAARHALGVCAPLIKARRLSVVELLTAAHPVVRGDAIRLRQVLWNLIQNAVKFTQQGGTIAVRTANPEPGVLVVEVEDNGFGIKPEMLRKIFEGFERAGRRADSSGGLGLGLAISRKIVELHGGTLTAASPGHGHGSTFTLSLSTDDAAGAGAQAPAADPMSPGEDRPLNVLLVEDHPPTAKAMARLLRSHGHTVQIANGLAEAERRVETERFDVLICDLHLPDGSGLDLLPRVRHHLRRWAAGGTEAPAIVLSGFSRESDVAHSLAAGYVAHLAKPVDQDELLAVIRRATSPRQ